MKTDQKTLTPDEVSAKLAKFGASLRNFRLARRLTHEDAASACAFSRQTLSRIEHGDPSVAVGQIARYANYLGANKALALRSPAGDPSKKRVRRTKSERAAKADQLATSIERGARLAPA